MGIIRFAINNPVKVTVGVMLLVLFGMLSVFAIPIQLIPNVDEPRITVTTFWEGASPQEIEREIVERQEEKLKGVSDLKKMTSTSTEGRAEVVLEFFVGTDKDAALRDVSDKLRQVSGYPNDVEEPTVQAADAALNSPIAWLIFFAGPGEDPSTLKDFAEDEIKPILERAQGVASVDVYGGREREVQIRVDAALMAARGVSFRDLENALRQQNKNISAGTITSGKRDYTWRTIGQFETVEQVENTVVAHREGGPVYVRDIGEVVSTYKKQYSFVRSVGRLVLALPVRRETGSNVIEVMKNLRVQIEKVNREILRPLNRELLLTQVYDETIYIHAAIDLVINNLFYGGILAIIVLVLFLRSASATAIMALCIPVSVVGSFLVVTVLGRTLNVVMLAGMAFAVGMVVDNSIVILENIYRHRQMGKDRFKAALDGAVEVWGAVLASTLTTMAVFLPVVFLKEEAGQLFRDIAIAIASAVGLSLLVAMTVIPTVCARALRTRRTKHADRTYGRIAQVFGGLIHAINGSVSARLAVCGVLIAGSLYGSYLLMAPTDYLPSGNRNLIFGFLMTPPGYALDEFLRMGEVLEDTVGPYWDKQFAVKDYPKGLPPDAQRAKEALDEKWRRTALAEKQAQIAAAEQRYAAAREAVSRRTSRSTPDHSLLSELKEAQSKLEKGREQLKSYRNSPPAIENFFYVAFNGRCFMGATSRDPDVVKPLVHLLEHAGGRVPGTHPIFFQTSLFGRITGSGNTIELEIRGDDLAEVTAAAEQLQMEIMMRFDYPQPDPANFSLGRPELQVIPDRIRAAQVGLNVRDVGQIVEACVDGAFVQGGFRERGDEIDLTIVVEGLRPRSGLDRLRRATPEQIKQTPIYTPIGEIVTLGSIAEVVKTSAPQQINHIEEMPSVTLTIRPDEDMALETAMNIVQNDIIAPMRQSGRIPNTVFTVAAGNADKLVQTRKALFGEWDGWNAESLVSIGSSRGGFAILITYLLMAALFESFVYPFVIMFTVVPATVGGFAGLRIVHHYTLVNPLVSTQKLDVVTMLGFVILVGIVVNNAILIVHQALNNMRDGGLAPREAITLSVRTRIRPIFMTALTSVCGMSPLVLMGGAGSELYKGLGSVVVGGLLVSTLFTLMLVPAMFSLFVDALQAIRPASPAERSQTGDAGGKPSAPLSA